MTQTTQQLETRVNAVKAPDRPETLFAPDVDIYEHADAIRLVADIPGADQQSVQATIENGVLTIEGTAQVDVPEGYELVEQEYRLGKFRRDFSLSEQVNTDAIAARVRNGTLELTLPKREEVKSKRVEIKS
ncbi:MAG: Hsp20/alpha crystallin family protein [Verrucomicrobia bacterium]|nr:Hsp20/alpha crystallin family protein [Verrucomicrobiota bacterium]